MSALFGIWHRDGISVNVEEYTELLDQHKCFGPDRQALTNLGELVFGQSVYFTTPQSFFEEQPCQHEQHAEWYIAGNIRLDYLEELYVQLDLSPEVAARWSDSKLFLYAFLKWGSNVGKHVYGDYVAAIWNSKTRELTLYKDRTGLLALYYLEKEDGTLVFSTSFNQITKYLEQKIVDEISMVNLLISRLDDREKSVFKGIRRVCIGSYVTINQQEITTTTYEDYKFSTDKTLLSHQQCAEKFREIFTSAVKSRARSSFPLGASLSGGLDSTSICYALQNNVPKAQPRLFTYSLLHKDTSPGNDMPYIEEAIRHGNFNSRMLESDPEEYRENFWKSTQQMGFPHFFINIGIFRQLWDSAVKDGVRVYFEGSGGDSMVPYGYDSYALLIRKGKLKALRTLGQLATGYEYIHYGGHNFYRLFKSFLKQFLGPAGYMFYKGDKYRFIKAYKRIVRAERKKRYRKLLLYGQKKHHDEITDILKLNDIVPLSEISSLYWTGAVVCPYADFRLVQFVASIPDELRMIPREPRWLYKDAFSGLMPQRILLRSTKGNYKEVISHITRKNTEEIEQDLKKIVLSPEEYKYSREETFLLNVINKSYETLQKTQAH